MADLPPIPDMIEIAVNVTVHRPAPTFSRRVESRGLGSDSLPCALGNDDIIVVEAGTPFLIEYHEGLAMIAKFGGRVITRPPAKES
jgi:hypothetical protein